MNGPGLQRKYIKIDGSSSSEPPPPREEGQSLVDQFATHATAFYRESVCKTLTREFNALRTKLTNQEGRPHTVQAYTMLQTLEERFKSIKRVVEAGGIAGLKAALDARRFIETIQSIPAPRLDAV